MTDQVEKIVSQLDASGYFVGPVVADESEREPGVFHIPGGAIDVAPPQVPEGKLALWQGDEWVFVNPPESVDPEPSVPQVVTMRQARLALLAGGHLTAIEAAIDALASPQKEAARIEWEYAQEVHRTDPLVQMLAPALDLTESDLDNLFTIAAGL